MLGLFIEMRKIRLGYVKLFIFYYEGKFVSTVYKFGESYAVWCSCMQESGLGVAQDS
jgi:hypothetical protein